MFKRAAFLGLSKADSIKRFFADVDVETYLEVDGMCSGSRLVPSKGPARGNGASIDAVIEMI